MKGYEITYKRQAGEALADIPWTDNWTIEGLVRTLPYKNAALPLPDMGDGDAETPLPIGGTPTPVTGGEVVVPPADPPVVPADPPADPGGGWD